MTAILGRLAGQVLLLAFMAAAAVAQPMRDAARLNGAYKEIIKEEAPVSGRALLGLSTVPVSWTGGPDLAVHVKASGAEQPICLTIVSRDGRYFARNDYTIPASLRGGLVRLPVETRHPELFAKASADGLAALVENGPCDTRQPTFRIAQGGPTSDGRSIVTFVNTGRAEATLLAGTPGAEMRFKCEPISDGKRTTFDAQCRATLPSVRSGELVPLQLELCSFGECRRNTLGVLLDE